MIRRRAITASGVVADIAGVRVAARRRDRHANVSLPGGSTGTPQCARAIVRSWLSAWQIPPALAQDMMIIVSELATNAVVHTKSFQVTIVVEVTVGQLAIRVIDQGPSKPIRVTRPADEGGQGGTGEEIAVSGRGLLLVDELADTWGAVRVRGGTSVWARRTLPAIPVPVRVPSER